MRRIARDRLRIIKLLHTAIWALFAASILSIPAFAWSGNYIVAAALSGLVFIECVVLALNRWRCPLTDMAARHTDDRRANFDIYLPAFLARHNKLIFGVLYVAGMLVMMLRWTEWLG